MKILLVIAILPDTSILKCLNQLQRFKIMVDMTIQVTPRTESQFCEYLFRNGKGIQLLDIAGYYVLHRVEG